MYALIKVFRAFGSKPRYSDLKIKLALDGLVSAKGGQSIVTESVR